MQFITWRLCLGHDFAAASVLVQATCRQALRRIPPSRSQAYVQVELLMILWALYRRDPLRHDNGLGNMAMAQLVIDKRVLYHTLSRADLDADCGNSRSHCEQL